MRPSFPVFGKRLDLFSRIPTWGSGQRVLGQFGMSRVLFGAAFAACATMGMAAQAETISLNDALGLAYEPNPNLDASRAGLRATDENVAKANASWRPTVNINGQYGYEREQFGAIPGFSPGGAITDHPLQGQLTVTQPIFRGGKT